MYLKNPIGFLFSKKADEGYVPNIDLFAHSVGLCGQNMTYSFVAGWWFTFCIDILGIDPRKVGAITSISRLWDAVNDPLIGSLVDKIRFKNGEKLRPYTIITPPIIGVLSLLMFVKFNFAPGVILALMMVLYFFWDLTYSFQDVALWGLIAVSSPHSEERTRVAQWISIGAGAGAALVGLFPNMLGDNVLNALHTNVATMYLVGGLIFGLGGELLSMSAYRQKERIKAETEKSDSIKDIFSGLMHNKVLLTISLARFLQQVTPVLDWIHFFESSVSYDIGSVHIDGGNAQFLFGLVTGIPGTFCLFAATKIVDKIGGRKRLLVSSQIFAIVLRVISYFVGYKSIGQMAVVMVLYSVMQIPAMMMDICHRSLISDSIDYVEWKTGVRNEGISFSIQNFISKMQSAVTSLIKGGILSLLHYDQTITRKYNQNATYIKWQWPIFMLGPVVGAVMYLIVICFVKDDKALKEQVERELKERRELRAKEKAEAEQTVSVQT